MREELEKFFNATEELEDKHSRLEGSKARTQDDQKGAKAFQHEQLAAYRIQPFA
jgi:hypothetical protein